MERKGREFTFLAFSLGIIIVERYVKTKIKAPSLVKDWWIHELFGVCVTLTLITQNIQEPFIYGSQPFWDIWSCQNATVLQSWSKVVTFSHICIWSDVTLPLNEHPSTGSTVIPTPPYTWRVFPRPPVGVWNCKWYQTLYILFFPYVHPMMKFNR